MPGVSGLKLARGNRIQNSEYRSQNKEVRIQKSEWNDRSSATNPAHHAPDPPCNLSPVPYPLSPVPCTLSGPMSGLDLKSIETPFGLGDVVHLPCFCPMFGA